ncbi:MAG TPA: hypothetical protein VGK90_00965 [Rhizomicrobium sp.]|jgi:hypothetical protein
MDQAARDHFDRVVSLYTEIMEEIKLRHLSMSPAMNGELPIHPRTAFEHCYLQLRMICELIGLACLVVHGNISVGKKSLLKEYKPGAIVSELEKLHTDFYPHPGEQRLNAAGVPIELNEIATGFLTKSDLVRLWNYCGNVLHRGSLKNLQLLLKQGGDFQEIQNWSQKIVTLLNHHQIAIADSTSQIWVQMSNVESGGNVVATLFELRPD